MKPPLLCRIGRHKFRSVMWPVGYAKHPTCVGECTRCGQVRDVEATAWGGVELGRWASIADMRQRIADEKLMKKPDGQEENAIGEARADTAAPLPPTTL